MRALLLVAHGSKKDKSNEEFRHLVKEIKVLNSNKYEKIKSAFLEFAEPSIEEVVKELSIENVIEISIYPYFLNSGKHVVSDIPNILIALENKYPNIKFKLFPHFGSSQKISTIISEEI
ncbi:sirohydrochlorin chelatase [Arcobacter sp.]|uniref:sirohydrochlorin chelatase n=1 Tax=unclassified Arcobacter TaxID=2593671 RepID=UPI003B001BA1